MTDPRNLGAVVRSVGAFGGHGVVVPQRRSAGMTAVAWRTSAGAAARLRVARATNLTRTLREYATAGLMIAGLDAEGSVSLDEFDLAADPLVLVVGSEGKGLSRLVKRDLRRHRLDPDGGPGGVAQRVGGRGRGARGGRPPPPRPVSKRSGASGSSAAGAGDDAARDVAERTRSPRRSRDTGSPGASDSSVPPTSASSANATASAVASSGFAVTRVAAAPGGDQ